MIVQEGNECGVIPTQLYSIQKSYFKSNKYSDLISAYHNLYHIVIVVSD